MEEYGGTRLVKFPFFGVSYVKPQSIEHFDPAEMICSCTVDLERGKGCTEFLYAVTLYIGFGITSGLLFSAKLGRHMKMLAGRARDHMVSSTVAGSVGDMVLAGLLVMYLALWGWRCSENLERIKGPICVEASLRIICLPCLLLEVLKKTPRQTSLEEFRNPLEVLNSNCLDVVCGGSFHGRTLRLDIPTPSFSQARYQ